MIELIKSTFYNEKLTKEKLCKFIKKTKRLSIGKHCADFEKSFSLWQNRKHAVMFNSGSSANLALMQSLVNLNKIKLGDSVGFSAVTWATNVMPLITMGLKPVPIDIELDTLNISSKKVIESYKKHKFKCLFVTNLLGYCDDIDKIRKFCKGNKIILLEDNCESLGSEYKKKKLGNFGLASTFSFYVGHHLSTIEGGMVRSHGWDRHLSSFERDKIRKKHKINEFYGKYAFYDIGYNLRPTEIQGFLGNDQLKYLDVMINKREENYRQFEKIYLNPDFIKINNPNLTKISNFAFPLICRTQAIRDKHVDKAKKAGIEIRPIVAGNINNQVFFKKHVKNKFYLSNTEKVHNHGFYFGNNPDMTKKEISKLIKTFS
ncbi:MAG: DegT/DnrJ/EryC1/StrS family aminotransferase [Patescibacteria group bacterium]